LRLQSFIHTADILFIEAVFRDADLHLATSKAHLTTTQAGEIARAASVRYAEPFHFSSRYRGEEESQRNEFLLAWKRCDQRPMHQGPTPVRGRRT
jgi:ribonuclease Z